MINYLKNEGIREFAKIKIMANFLQTYKKTIIRHRMSIWWNQNKVLYIFGTYIQMLEERRHNNKIKKLYFVKYNKTFILLN